ncbi:class I SAM-dependent methyltransferase family protein [Micromonospora sp. WMMD1102]|uniref:class I SAM-dependent methyltransferase family protein n=1 Tax=Micromonospora sp. WMMD1102 TaxID=3016105 RepID=UPI0024150516|nr:class I SAM-dependent methyltransferase family protein [Micromonospora sp. WMMD1102]MDG4788692.1 class I SAM-dependent methyltransferase family protein [Micromonospora sp. WMMD1102]
MAVEGTNERDWHRWHDDYTDPTSPLSRRLATVQARIREFLDAAAPGPVRVVSVCAGQGRDLLDVLAAHPRRADVTARLVELDPRNARAAADAARAAGLDGVEVVVGDAAVVDRYAGLVPADLVLVCGVFGNVTDEDVRRTVGYCAQLCATGGTVVWTRHRREPDLVPRVCEWFAAEGFEPGWLSPPEAGFGVGTHRFTGTPRPLDRGGRMFTFVDR